MWCTATTPGRGASPIGCATYACRASPSTLRYSTISAVTETRPSVSNEFHIRFSFFDWVGFDRADAEHVIEIDGAVEESRPEARLPGAPQQPAHVGARARGDVETGQRRRQDQEQERGDRPDRVGGTDGVDNGRNQQRG